MTTDNLTSMSNEMNTASERTKRAGLTTRQREALAGYLFILPDVVGLLIFIGIPMLMALTIGFFDVNGFGGFTFVGLANYQRMIGDPLFWQCMRVTSTYVVL